jgi:hypothetical protein
MNLTGRIASRLGVTKRRRFRAVGEFLVVGICTLAFALTIVGICMLLLTGNAAGERDFVSYWAAGHQLAHHADPYDADAILQIENSVGFDAHFRVVIMRNPPSALLLVLPLSLFGMNAGALFWSLLLLACLIASVRMLWIMHGRQKNYLHYLGYSFGPALACVLAGQTSLFALLGLVLFLRFHRAQPFLAGISLWLCALKPHLFLPFGLVLLEWTVVTKSYRVLIGAYVSLAASCVTAYFLDPLAWAQYGRMMRTSGIDTEFIPCLSIPLRLGLSPHSIWLQYAPAAVGCAWALRYFWKYRLTWDWMEHGGLLTAVSILVAPYAWFADEAILIPALLYAAYLNRSRSLVALLALASAVIEIETLFRAPFHSPLYIWTAPAWLACYLYAARSKSAQPSKACSRSLPAEPREAVS